MASKSSRTVSGLYNPSTVTVARTLNQSRYDSSDCLKSCLMAIAP